jgi:hypothetical protein
LEPIIHSDAKIFFSKINPSKYKVIIHLVGSEDLVFNQSHSYQWMLYLGKNTDVYRCDKVIEYNGGSRECIHDQALFEGEELSYLYKKPIFNDYHRLVNDYANAWTIDSEYIKQNFPEDYYKKNPDGSIDVELILYFRTQSYFYLGLIIFSLALFSCFVYLGYDFVKKQEKKDGE